MTRNRFTNANQTVSALIPTLLFAIIIAPLNGQTSFDSRLYGISREVTISGIVSGVLTRPAPGMAWGPHLLITTVTGPVDVNLGRWSVGKGGISASVGQQVEVTGIPTTRDQSAVFIPRTVRVNGKLFTVRDERGVPISPQARHRTQERGSL
jgi:hypothetical protein